MEFPAKTPAELANDLRRCEKVTLKFDNENHTLTPEEVHWLIAALTNHGLAEKYQPEVDFSSPKEAEEYERSSGLLNGTYPQPVEHYEREARNLAAVWANGNDGARTCILAALLKAASPTVPKERPFYGAECGTYPNCKGGCGLGCTHDIETRRRALALPNGEQT